MSEREDLICRLRRIALFFVGAIVLVVICAQLLLLGVNAQVRRRAEALLQDMRTLKAGESTMSEVQRIVDRYRGQKSVGFTGSCSSPDASYSIGVYSDALLRVGETLPTLRKYGVKPWSAGGTLLVKNGLLCYSDYVVRIPAGDADQELKVSVAIQPSGSSVYSDPQNHRYGIDNGVVRHYIHRLEVSVTPEASSEELRHAFQFNFSCLTGITGCRQPCELLPLVWRDYVRRSHDLGWTLPQEEANDSKCASLTQ
jgi:hypothetical protein